MKTRIIETKFWKDDFISGLTMSERLFFIYLLTNERVNIIHCYEITPREITFDTGLDSLQIEKAKEKLQAAGKVGFYKNYVYLVNSDRYETYTGDRNETAKERITSQLPQDVLGWYKAILDRGMDRGINTPPIPTISHKSEIINNNMGVVKGEKTLDYLLNVPDKDVAEYVISLKVTTAQVKDKAVDLYNYCKARGKKYQDYRAFLRNALKKDFVDQPVKNYKFATTKV